MNISDLKTAGEFAQSGIYKITNLVNFKCYVGSAIRIDNRFKNHKKKLKYSNHPNKHLQASYNKNGLENFSFEVIEYCDKAKLLEREQYWINSLNCSYSEFGYNKRKIANSNLGIKFSEETKAKMATAQLGHSRKTRPLTEE
jgi:group I intron endonuclease